jgi:hypothetical protein
MPTTRRDLLRIGAILGVAAVVMARPWARAPDLAFEDMPGLPPLRRFAGPGAVGGSDPGQALFAGLDLPSEDERALADRLRATICDTLGLGWEPGGPLPITYFTDIRCPSCRVLEASLANLAHEIPFRLVTREFPVFGPRSEAAARAIVAAGSLGAGETARARLLLRPAPETAEAAAELAADLSLDPETYLAAWRSPDTTARLAEDRALARLLGLPGTPGLVIGRTIALGALPRATLARLMDAERAGGPPAACA